MGQLEDDKREIMDAVRSAIEGAINRHTLNCPMAMSHQDHERIMTDLYNGNDGKSGLVAEFRTFITAWNTRNVDHDKRIAQAWKKRAVYSVFVVALLVYPIDRAWNLVQDVVRLTDEWKHYVPPPPQAKQHSFFDDEHITKPTLANNE